MISRKASSLAPIVSLRFSVAIEEHHRSVVRPEHILLQNSSGDKRRKGKQQHGTAMHPVTQCRSRNVQPVSHENIFAAIRRQMIAALADNQRGQKAGPCDALLDRLQWDRCRRDSALTAGAGVFLQVVVVNLQLSGHELQHPTDLFADARFVALANTTDFLFVRHIVMMFELRQRIQTQLAIGTLLSTTGSFLLSGRSQRGVFSTGSNEERATLR